MDGNDPVKGSLKGTVKGPSRTLTHRIRLRDDEIKLISEGLRELINKRRAEGVPWRDLNLLHDLAHRFNTWGDDSYGSEGPFYARRSGWKP